MTFLAEQIQRNWEGTSVSLRVEMRGKGKILP